MILFDDDNYRLFGATLAVEIVPLSVPNCWILQINGQSSSNVVSSRPTRDLESHKAVTTDTMHLVVVPWGCSDGIHCMRPDKSISKFYKRCVDIDKRSDVDTWRQCAF